MARQVIGIGASANDGTGDNLRVAGGKINDNFTELYDATAALVKNNFAATIAPAVTDDSASGYAVGSSWLIPGTGEMWRCRSNVAGVASWVKVDTADFDTYVAGRYYLPFASHPIAAGTSTSPNVLRFFYGIIKQRVTIDQFAVRVSSAGTNASIALNKSRNCRPTGNPIAKTASFAISAAAAFNAPPDAGNTTLEPGSYWFGIAMDAAATVFGFATAPNSSSIVGSTSVTDIIATTGVVTGVSVAGTFGTWPDLTAASFSVISTSSQMPAILFRVVSVP